MSDVTIVRQLTSTPERVWRAFTTPDELAAWFWPQAWDVVGAVDLRVGGHFRLASAHVAVSGEYVAVDENRRLVTTWRWDGDEQETLVTYRFEPSDDGTLLTIVHERFTTPEDVESHQQGWDDCLDRLAPYLAT